MELLLPVEKEFGDCPQRSVFSNVSTVRFHADVLFVVFQKSHVKDISGYSAGLNTQVRGRLQNVANLLLFSQIRRGPTTCFLLELDELLGELLEEAAHLTSVPTPHFVAS